MLNHTNIDAFVDVNNTNGTIYDTDPIYYINVGYAVFIPCLISVIVLMNVGTIVAFWKVPSLRDKPSELLILNLACADLVTGTTVLPLTSPLYITPGIWRMGEIGCGIVVFFLNLSISGSLFALTTISIDRFLLVYLEYPRYLKTMTRARVYKIIASGWFFAFLTIVIELSLWEKAKEIDATAKSIDFDKVCLSPARRVQEFALCFFLTLFMLPVLTVCSLSIGFLYHLQRRLQKFKNKSPAMRKEKQRQSISSTDGLGRKQTTTSSTNLTEMSAVNSQDAISDQSEERPKQERSSIEKQQSERVTEKTLRNRYIKPGLTLLGVVLAMAVCMLPFIFYVITIEAGCEVCNNTDVLYGLLLMQFCNASIDPFIYVLTRKKMRTFYSSFMATNILKRGSKK